MTKPKMVLCYQSFVWNATLLFSICSTVWGMFFWIMIFSVRFFKHKMAAHYFFGDGLIGPTWGTYIVSSTRQVGNKLLHKKKRFGSTCRPVYLQYMGLHTVSDMILQSMKVWVTMCYPAGAKTIPFVPIIIWCNQLGTMGNNELPVVRSTGDT